MLIPLEQPVTVPAGERRPKRSPAEIMDIVRARERSLSQLLMLLELRSRGKKICCGPCVSGCDILSCPTLQTFAISRISLGCFRDSRRFERGLPA